jgi:hypothetical protein
VSGAGKPDGKKMAPVDCQPGSAAPPARGWQEHAVVLLLAGLLAGLIGGTIALSVSDAFQAGFSGADEPAHFLNGYFVSSYFKHHFGSNPMAYAAEFYLHYPKISIGHWPPAYYGLLGMILMPMQATVQHAFLINLVIAALPAAGVALATGTLARAMIVAFPATTTFHSAVDLRSVAHPGGRTHAGATDAGSAIARTPSGLVLTWAFFSALIYAFAPLVIEGQAFFMADQALAACCAVATIVWVAYVRRPGWKRALPFAALCALAVLIKGNGWLLGLLPVFHIVLTGRWRLLTSPRLYVALGLVALAVVPWYKLTAGISADGFNYRMGAPYAWLALKTNAVMLAGQVGLPGLLLAGWAVVTQFRQRLRKPESWLMVSAALSLVLATLTLQSIVPVDIVDRYMAPALPAIVVLAMTGIGDLGARLLALHRQAAGNTIALILAMSMLVPGIVHLAEREPKIGYRTAEVLATRQVRQLGPARPADPAPSAAATSIEVQTSAPARKPGPMHSGERASQLWLIDGNSGAEGAFIADMATGDPNLDDYAVRASKLFADSNFMGSSYTLKFSDARAVLEEVKRLGIGKVVIVRAYDLPAYGHSVQLFDAVRLPDSGFVKKLSLAHRNRKGTTEYYEATGPVLPNIAAIRKFGLPAKAGGLANQL